MNFKKAILSTTCLVLLSVPVQAGWDQNSQQRQFSGRTSIQAQLERLERENEQLRNAVAQMRKNGHSNQQDRAQSSSNDVRIQALIEENKRLLKQLEISKKENIDSLSVGQIYSLNQENESLNVQLKALRETNDRLLQEKTRMQKALNSGQISQNIEDAQIDTSKFEARIQDLEKMNAALKSEIKLFEGQSQTSSELKKQINEKSKLIGELESLVLSLKKDKSKLSADLSDAKASAKKGDNKEQEFLVLQNENKKLRNQKDSLLAEKEKVQRELKAQISAKKVEATAFETRIADLERNLVQLKDKEDAQSRGTQTSDIELKNKITEKIKQISNLEQQVVALSQEKRDLSAKIKEQEKAPATNKTDPKLTKEIATLKKQNESLRDTIKAQTTTLKQSDNAVQRAEALTSENLRLKKQLELANTAKSSNDDTAQSLILKNKELIAQINDYKQKVTHMEGLKETVRALREQNNQYSSSQQKAKEASAEVTALEQQNKGLQQELIKEREYASSYRAEIGKYQKQVAELQSNNTKGAGQETEITALRLENQELKARIDLLSSKASKTSVVFKKENDTQEGRSSENLLEVDKVKGSSAVTYIKGENEVVAKDIKVVETSYPKVDKVKPLLNDEGQHIYKAVKPQAVNTEELTRPEGNGPKAEDLLSQELRPLAGE